MAEFNRSYLWKIELQGVTGLWARDIQGLAQKDVEKIGVVDEDGHKEYHDGIDEYGDITVVDIKRGSVSKALWALADQKPRPRFSFTVIQYDTNKNPINIWRVVDAWIRHHSLQNMNRDSNSMVEGQLILVPGNII